MSDLITIVFNDEKTAFELREKLFEEQRNYLIELEDAVVVTKDAKSKIKLHQVTSLAAQGAASGGLLGGMIGLLFLNPLLGMVAGAGAGAISGSMTDLGISDNTMKEMAEAFDDNTSALFVLIRKVTADKVLEDIQPIASKGKVFKTSLTQEKEDKLKAMLASKNA